MVSTAPHFLLLSEANLPTDEGVESAGQWRFVLEATDGSTVLEAQDEEADLDPERLELLAVVRGLEALGQPSRVTLVTSSRYVSQGMRFGLEEWRENDWQWERFGEWVPIKNSDLWRRVDHALAFHQVECRVWRIDRSHRAVVPRRGMTRRDSQGPPPEADHSATSSSVSAPHFAMTADGGDSSDDGALETGRRTRGRRALQGLTATRSRTGGGTAVERKPVRAGRSSLQHWMKQMTTWWRSDAESNSDTDQDDANQES